MERAWRRLLGGDLFNLLGVSYEMAGDQKKALSSYTQSLELRIKTGDLDGQAWCLNNIGSVRDTLGERTEALRLFGQALASSGEREFTRIITVMPDLVWQTGWLVATESH